MDEQDAMSISYKELGYMKKEFYDAWDWGSPGFWAPLDHVYKNVVLDDMQYILTEQNKMKLFEYVAFFVPNEEQKKNVGLATSEAKILLDDKVLAESEEAVKRKVIRLIPADYESVIDQIQVVVRAFR